mmetsp:Transcript_32150/g.44058  ORF Transcript_32150/g.44058 Transcript_32150/m.44058 type:complete len:224 (+) Transcript_32150:331-1002(+)
MLSFVQIPQHSGTILSTRGTEGAVRRNGDSVDVTGVTREVSNQLAVLEVPHLNQFIPSSRDNQRFGTILTNRSNIGGKSDTADPLTVTVILNGVLANSKSVPQFDGLVARSRDNLAVVSGESNTQHILLVSNELAVASSCVDIPKTESPVPRTRQHKLTIRGNHNIRNVVRVASESFARSSKVGRIFSCQIPNNDGLVTRTGNDNILFFWGSDNGSNPTRVTF